MIAVHEPSNSLLLSVPDPLYIRELLPRSKLLPLGPFNVAVKHTLEAVKVLRNIGVEAPSPVLTSYDWPGKYKPMAHQRTIVDFFSLHKRGFNLSDPGVGKTAASLWCADWLMNTGRVKRALVLAPLSTLERVWLSDIFDVLMHRKAVVVHGTVEQRMRALETMCDFYILNHDGITIPRVHEHLRARDDIDLVILDEASMFRNHQTRKYKKLESLLRPDQRFWPLTGTPCPNEPTDAWALARLINPGGVPRSYGQFRRQTMTQVSQFKWAPRPDAFAKAYEALQPAVRFRKADCLDLPPVVTLNRQAPLSAEQEGAVRTMKTYMQTTAAETVITAVNAADQINKMRQLLCGVVKDAVSDTYVAIDHAPRTKVLMEAIEQATAKVLVIVPFKGIIQSLEKEISQHYSVAVLNGDVTPKARDAIIRDFKTTDSPHVLLCHPKVMAHGLNLTEADTLIFYAPIYSNDEFQQVTERFNRTGQTRKMTITRIAAHKLEWEIYRLVDERKTTQDSVLSLYKAMLA